MAQRRPALLVVKKVEGSDFRTGDLPQGKVAVMFAADWCGFSRRFQPHFERIREGWVVDISDEDLPVWDELDIDVVPTVILFEDGVPTKRWAGVLTPEVAQRVGSALSGDLASSRT